MALIHVLLNVASIAFYIDSSTANSSSYTLQNCKCAHYEKHNLVGPYCATWISTDPPFCYVSGGSNASFCPGVALDKTSGLYWTEDETVCNRSIYPRSEKWNFRVRSPFQVHEIVQLCLYPLNALIGTVGNVLVIKNFASANSQGRPGSRFVIVLAAIDFVSSLWLPSYVLLHILNQGFWPYGEKSCQMINFHHLLFYSTAWLILAISLERARAVYKPFAEKLQTKFVVMSSAAIIGCSFAFAMKRGLSGKIINYGHIYIDGIDYELNKCILSISVKDNLIFSTSIYAIGILLPMLLIVMVYISIYVKLKKQAQFRRHSASINSDAQIVQLSQTFTIVVLVFFICYLPITLLATMSQYSLYRNKSNAITKIARTIFTVLLFGNSCMNPIIYSKIHVKIYNHVKRFILTCKGRDPSLETPRETTPAALAGVNKTIQSKRYSDHESAHAGPYQDLCNSCAGGQCDIEDSKI